jgi:hypothetical protein
MGEFDKGRHLTPAEGDPNVATEDEVVTECSQHHNPTWLCALQRVPAFVRAFNTAAIRPEVLIRALETPFSDMFELFLMYLAKKDGVRLNFCS